MALLNICAITGANIVVQVGLAFIRQEREVDYNWALEFLRDIMAKESIQEPLSIVTDREIALIKALQTQFPSVASSINRTVHTAVITVPYGIVPYG